MAKRKKSTKPKPFKALGSTLKRSRDLEGLTQKEVGDAIDVHVQFVSNWERGLCAPPKHVKKKLAKVLGLERFDIQSSIETDFFTQHLREMKTDWGFR